MVALGHLGQVSKESVLEKDSSERLPLHLAFDNGAPPLGAAPPHPQPNGP